MMAFLFRLMRAVVAIVFVLGLVMLLHAGFDQYQQHENTGMVNAVLPVPYLHSNIDDNAPKRQFHAGEVMFLHTEVVRKIACSVDSNYRIIEEHKINDITHRVVWYTYAPTRTAVAPGLYISDVHLEIPAWLRPGDYLLDRNAAYSCYGNKIEGGAFVPFTIVAE